MGTFKKLEQLLLINKCTRCNEEQLHVNNNYNEQILNLVAHAWCNGDLYLVTNTCMTEKEQLGHLTPKRTATITRPSGLLIALSSVRY